MKKFKGEGNFPSYFDNNDVTYIKMPNFGFNLGQEKLHYEWMNIYFTNVHLKIIDNIINEVKLKLNEISYEHIMIIIIDES